MKTRLLFRAALCLALIAIGARIQIPLPYFDYYTLQFTFVLLTAVVLPPLYALAAVGGYVLLGLLGVPVFAGGGGIGYVLRPSFGYLLGFLVTAGVLSEIYQRTQINTRKAYYALNSLGIVITYLFGLTYKAAILSFYMNQAVPFWTILTGAFAFDIPADFLMILLLSAGEARIVRTIRGNKRGQGNKTPDHLTA